MCSERSANIRSLMACALAWFFPQSCFSAISSSVGSMVLVISPVTGSTSILKFGSSDIYLLSFLSLVYVASRMSIPLEIFDSSAAYENLRCPSP